MRDWIGGLASFIVCKGRRRIGKSRLFQEFGKRLKHFYQFQGAVPSPPGSPAINQLANFSNQFAEQFRLPSTLRFQNWTEAFSTLANQCQDKGPILVLLDEISWMALGHPDFSAQLKIAWDTKFKGNSDLILVVSGSLSSWIDENILNSTGFVGRISLSINLKELSLSACNYFWGKQKDRISSFEKAKLLSVTGGIPRYLEEIDPKLSAEENIRKLCFRQEGFLFTEFNNLFNDLFSKKASSYREILETLTHHHLNFSEIAKKISRHPTGYLLDCLTDLHEAGFLAKDSIYKLDHKNSTRVRYRLLDNYTRFYLHYIQPQTEKIKAGLYSTSLDTLPGWEIIAGLQFENLVLSNISRILEILCIPLESINNVGPYFQSTNKRQQGVQIDLLINTKHTIYICEVKFRENIDTKIIEEVKQKIKKLKIPTHKSIRPVLIYAGSVNESIVKENYFDAIISFDQLIAIKTASS